MINTLEIRNFQSVKQANLDLGKFTVILGPSNSGKSAVVRAVQALSSNIRGSSFVTQGQKMASVSASSDSWKITLEKGEGHAAYRVFTASDGEERTYTKLASGVPDQVVSLLSLGVSDAGSLSYAGQDDVPFLIKESGASVARVLGDLTNVSTVFNAVRESNRRKSVSSAELKTRSSDLDQLKSKSAAYASLKDRASALESAENLLSKCSVLNSEINVLSGFIDRLEDLETPVVVKEVPDISSLLKCYEDFKTYHLLVLRLLSAEKSAQELTTSVTEGEEKCQSLTALFQKTLQEAGQCPTCGQLT